MLHEIILFVSGAGAMLITMAILSLRMRKKANKDISTFEEQLKREINAAYQRGIVDMAQKLRSTLKEGVRKEVETVFLSTDYEHALHVKMERDIRGAITKIVDNEFPDRNGYYAVSEKEIGKDTDIPY